MEKNKKQFKLVYSLQSYSYYLWVSDEQDNWLCHNTFPTVDDSGKPFEGDKHVYGLVGESIIWEIDRLTHQGYEFLGIKLGYKD